MKMFALKSTLLIIVPENFRRSQAFCKYYESFSLQTMFLKLVERAFNCFQLNWSIVKFFNLCKILIILCYILVIFQTFCKLYAKFESTYNLGPHFCGQFEVTSN